MGKIALILGPHAVGKTTLFNYAKNRNEIIVFDGYRIPLNNLNLSNPNDFVAYQMKYIEKINAHNSEIKLSEKHGFVNRSIEESEYYFYFHNYRDEVMKIYQKEYEKKENIKVDLIVFLDADFETLKKRFSGDALRDMKENTEWYENEYAQYVDYWKKNPKVRIVDTVNKSVDELYEQVMKLLCS